MLNQRQRIFNQAAKVADASDYNRLMMYAIKYGLTTEALGS